MGQLPAASQTLSSGEQRALAAFLTGRLPAGQLDAALCRARAAALAAAAAAAAPAAPVPPAVRAA